MPKKTKRTPQKIRLIFLSLSLVFVTTWLCINLTITNVSTTRNEMTSTFSLKHVNRTKNVSNGRIQNISAWKEYVTAMLHTPPKLLTISRSGEIMKGVEMNNYNKSEIKRYNEIFEAKKTPKTHTLLDTAFNFIHKEWLNEKLSGADEQMQGNSLLDDQLSNDVPVIPRDLARDTMFGTTKTANDPFSKAVDIADTRENTTPLAIRDQDERVEEADSDRLRNDAYIYRRHVYNQYYREIRNQKDVDCRQILQGDNQTIQYARELMSHKKRNEISTKRYTSISSCNNFKRTRGFIDHPLSEDEKSFPIAFALIVYRDVEQIERLLRAIYRPHNYYCIHVDIKTSQEDQRAISTIANCFENVFLSSRAINVTWGEFSVLETELICMKDLLKKKNWKYYINLTGQEFPLKTNREIVKILEAMKGDNVVEGYLIRAKQRYFYRWTKSEIPPPHRIRPVKGSVHVAINRDFVDFCLHDERAQDYLSWVRRTDISDESFFASLNYNAHLGAPGAFKGPFSKIPRKSSFMRYKTWRTTNSTRPSRCTGKYVHNICILGIGDLHRAYRDVGLFVNKLRLDFDYLAFECLEEVLHDRTWKQYLDDAKIKVAIHTNLNQTKYIITH